MNKSILSLSVGVVLLVVANVGLSVSNETLTAEVSARSAYLQQTGSLNNLYKELVGSLAELASKTQDARLKELLDKNGLSLASVPSRSQSQSQPVK